MTALHGMPCSIRAAAVLCSIAIIPIAEAQTGSSAWITRKQPETPKSDVPRAKETKRTPVETLRKGQMPAGRGTKSGQPGRLGPATAMPSGDDAAYIAFAMGQYLTALRLAAEAAKKGEATAHTLVGRIHADGLGVPQNPALAAQWYARGAELGDVEAAFSYGVLLAAGKGVKKDRAKAGAMFEAAAKKGHPYAHYNLALLFLSGDGKPENPRRAALHLEYAASKGVTEAQYDLATLYQKGHGVAPDAYKAAYWIRQAAEGGMAAAQYDYALMLLRGQGLNADQPKAVDYLKAAAGHGLPGAQNRLAHIYFAGVTVNRDPVEATKWRLLAQAGGGEDKGLDTKIAGLPVKVRQEAERAADAYREQMAVGTPPPGAGR